MKTVVWLIALCGLPAPARGQFPEIPASTLQPPLMDFDDGQDPMRSRLFRTTSRRTQIDLGGWWEFAADPGDAGETAGHAAGIPEPETRLWVPGTWNAAARYWNYVGPAWYQRRFEMPAGGNLRLHFGSVFHTAKVWLDGRLVGEHEGGYLPFDCLVPKVAKGPHRLVVRVDNRLTADSLPKQNVDWFPYGGIDRPVYAEIVPDQYIEHVQVLPVLDGGATAKLRVRAALRNLAANEAAADLRFEVDGVEVYRGEHAVPAGGGPVAFEAALRNPRLWSPSSPHLYSARMALGERDDQFTRFGVREVRVAGGAMVLNGERLKVMGVNRHEDHPEWGSASPPHVLHRDIEIIKRLGANTVRGHYSFSELFMDFCDQYGLLVMAEVPAWQYSAEQLRAPAVQEKILHHLEEMVRRDAGRPSVLTWSLGNEWPGVDRSYEVFRALLERARRLDSTRPFTLVTGGPHVRRVHELLDVICVNWARYQWYDPFTVLDRAEGEKSAADLALIHQRYPDKPVILTEFGGSEALAGWHNWGNVKWSEEFQSRNVEDSAWHALEQDWISGGCVWQYCDSRSTPERFLAGRLVGWNGKGIVDAYRSPKLAFYRLQHVFRSWTNKAFSEVPLSGRPGGGR